jgi:hypothetical protein
MTEIVHCKSKREVGVASATAKCADRYLHSVLSLSAAPIVVIVGMKAHAQLKQLLSQLPAKPPYIAPGLLGGKDRQLIYAHHPSAFVKGRKDLEGLYGERLNSLRAIAHG